MIFRVTVTGAAALPRLFVILMFLLVNLLAVFAWAPCAYAHAALIATDPPHSATLAAAPKRIILTFNEPVSPLVFNLLDPDGGTVPLGAVHQEDNRLAVELPSLHMAGTYALSWRAVSADGHPVSGALVFAVGASSKVPTSTEAGNLPLSIAIWSARLALYLGLFFGVGGAVFRAFLSPVDNKPNMSALIFVGVAGVVVSLALFGLDALGAPFTDWYRPVVWAAALSTTVGIAALLSLLALALAIVAQKASGRMCKAWALLALCLLGLSLAASGHASVAPPQWLSRPAVWLHGVVLAVWLGSLLPLALALRHPLISGLASLRCFSLWIPYTIALLIVSGLALAYLQLDGVASLWETTYGQILSVKLVLVAGLLGLGAYNRYRLTRGVLQGEAQPRRRMCRVIFAEFAVAALVLAVVALWRFTPPPRSLTSAVAAHEVSLHISSAKATAQITLKPGHTGKPGQLQLFFFDAGMAPLPVSEVSISFSNAQVGIEPIRYQAKHENDGSWQIAALALPDLPRWSLRIEALVSDFDRVILTTDIEFIQSGAK